MPSYNKVLLMGNLTRDPELKYLPSQMAVVEFGLACNRKFKTSSGESREEVLFVDCSAFGKTGETIAEYMVKGKPLFVEGRLKLDTWDDKKDGSKRSKLTVVVDNFQFVGGKGEGDDTDQRPPVRKGPPPRGQRPAPSSAPQSPFNEPTFTEDDIPFAWQGRAGQPI